MKRLYDNSKYFLKYNTLKLKSECEQKSLCNEIGKKVIEIKELKEEIKALKQKNRELRVKNKELKEKNN